MYTPLSQRKQQKQSTGGDSSVDDIMGRISSVESGGRYDALGPEVKTGMYAGERALGKYQIMPGNLPSWSKEALGREVTSEEFLADPELLKRLTYSFTSVPVTSLAPCAWATGRPVNQTDAT